MNHFMILQLCLLAAATAMPTREEETPSVTKNTNTTKEDTLVVTRDYFIENNVKYTGKHDIVNIIVPLNKINFEDDDEKNDSEEVSVFFVEAEVNDNGDRIDKGVYVLKNGTATKILDNGRAVTAVNDDSKTVYIGASDGIYVYNDSNGATNKYGSLTDDILQIEADNKTGVLYFLTNDQQVFSVADEGTKKNKLDIKDVKEIAIDYNSNLFYYDNNKDLYVFNKNGNKIIEGIPSRHEIKLVRPMFALEDGVFAVIDNVLYLLDADGTAEKSKVNFEVKPTAYAPEATLIQYYAFEKKIYEFNVLAIIATEIKELKDFLEDKQNEIQSIATKSRSTFGA